VILLKMPLKVSRALLSGLLNLILANDILISSNWLYYYLYPSSKIAKLRKLSLESPWDAQNSASGLYQPCAPTDAEEDKEAPHIL